MKIRAMIRRDNTGLIEVYPYKTPKGNVDMFSHVTVTRSTSIDDVNKLEQAKINAPSTGTVTPAEAIQFAEALRGAAAIARCWDLSLNMGHFVSNAPIECEAISDKEVAAYHRERKAEQRARERRRAAAEAAR